MAIESGEYHSHDTEQIQDIGSAVVDRRTAIKAWLLAIFWAQFDVWYARNMQNNDNGMQIQEHTETFDDFENRLCAGFLKAWLYNSSSIHTWAETHTPSHLHTKFSVLEDKTSAAKDPSLRLKREKVNNDIFQEEIYRVFHKNSDSITSALTQLWIPGHKHLKVFTSLQVLFSKYMIQQSWNTAVRFLTAGAFSQLSTILSSLGMKAADLSAYLQRQYIKTNPKLAWTDAKFLAPYPEVWPDLLPAPQQYTIATASWTVKWPHKQDRRTVSQKLRAFWYTFSSSRLGGKESGNVYAEDRTTLHGLSTDVCAYMDHLMDMLHTKAGQWFPITAVVSWWTEPDHWGTKYFSWAAKSAWNLKSQPAAETAKLSLADRKILAKTHGSGNKIDISSRGLTGYLLSVYFWLRTEMAVTTKKETVWWKVYFVQARFHLGHFDICVLPEKLSKLL